MENLPPEMLEELAIRVAKDAQDPMEELAILRASCPQLRAVCGSPLVGRSIPLLRVLQRPPPNGNGWWTRFYYSRAYRANLTTTLAAAGNPEACFRSGISAVFVEGRGDVAPPLYAVDMLQRAAASGHELCAYVLAMVLYRWNSGRANDATARRILREIEGDGPAGSVAWRTTKIALYRNEARMVLQDDLVVPNEVRGHLPVVAMPVDREDGHQCRRSNCGELSGYVGLQRVSSHVYCSEECRIRVECRVFFFQLLWS